MSRTRMRQAVALIGLLLGACTTTPPAPIVGPASSAPATERGATRTPAPPAREAAPSIDGAPVASVKPVYESHPAAVRLLAAARDAVATGRYDSAGAKIDQAIRIDSADPWVWHELARLRFVQGEFGQAVATARRSNALSGAPAQLLYANLNLIAEAERLRGNGAASAQALRDAQRYESDAVRSD